MPLHNNPGDADAVRTLPWTEDHMGRLLTIAAATSSSFADMGYIMVSGVSYINIINTTGATLFVTPDAGNAGILNYPIPDGGALKISGRSSKLENYRFYSVAGGDFGAMMELTLQDTAKTTSTTTTTTTT